MIDVLKKNKVYLILTTLTFLLAYYKYGLHAALLGLFLLTCMFGLITCSALVFTHFRKGKQKTKLNWVNVCGVVLFGVGIMLFDLEIRKFAFIFVTFIFILFVIYSEIWKKT